METPQCISVMAAHFRGGPPKGSEPTRYRSTADYRRPCNFALLDEGPPVGNIFKYFAFPVFRALLHTFYSMEHFTTFSLQRGKRRPDMIRIVAFALASFVGLVATDVYGQAGCMHHGGGGGSMMGGPMGMGMGMGGSSGGISSMIQQASMQNQFAQQQFVQQLYMQQQYEQQLALARQVQRAARRADRITVLKERRATELAKSSAKTKPANAPELKNLSELILAGKK
jgi:hypothetical protein